MVKSQNFPIAGDHDQAAGEVPEREDLLGEGAHDEREDYGQVHRPHHVGDGGRARGVRQPQDQGHLPADRQQVHQALPPQR